MKRVIEIELNRIRSYIANCRSISKTFSIAVKWSKGWYWNYRDCTKIVFRIWNCW